MLSFYLSILETAVEQKKMTEFYEQYKYYCIFIANKLLNNRDDAEDATHAAFMEIIKHKQKYFALERSDFRASLVVIVKNKAYDILRHQKKERTDEGNSLDDTVDGDISVVDYLSVKEEYDMLREALKNLTPSYSTILTMKYFEDKSNADIAAALQITKKNVEIRLYRAKVRLRKELEKSRGVSNETTTV